MTNIVTFPTARPRLRPGVLAPWSLSEDEALAGVDALVKSHEKKLASKVPLLGAATWLMMQQPSNRCTPLNDLDWRVMPALMQDQARLYTSADVPIALVTWARLDDCAARRYLLPPHKLTANDWCSGAQIWIIDIFTRLVREQEVFDDLRETVFAGQIVRRLIPGTQVFPEVVTWPAVPAKNPSERR